MRLKDINNILIILVILIALSVNQVLIAQDVNYDVLKYANAQEISDQIQQNNDEIAVDIPAEVKESADELVKSKNTTESNFDPELKTHVSDEFVTVYKRNGKYKISYTLGEGSNLGVPHKSAYKKIEDNIYQYDNVYDGIDLRFTKSNSDVLEEFIVDSKEKALEITELPEIVSHDGLYYETNFDGSITFRDENTTEVIFSIPKPVMYELNDKDDDNYGLHYEIYKKNDKTYLVKVIDKQGREWLADSNRQYPIVVDATTVDTSTSVNATVYSFQRKIWFDGQRYWVSFYSYGDTRLEFWYSEDGTSWTENTSARLSYANYDYSIVPSSGYLYIAYTRSNDIRLRKAKDYPSGLFSWDTEVTIFDGTGSTNAYRYPNVSVSPNGNVFVTARHYIETSATITDVTEDGTVDSWGGQDTSSDYFGFGRQKFIWWYYQERGYIEWNVASKLPYDANITDVDFTYHGYQRDYDGQIRDLKTYRPSTSSASDIYSDAGGGTTYINPSNFPQVASNQTVDLGTTADSDLEGQLSSGWFAIGVRCDTEGSGTGRSLIYSEDNTSSNPAPRLSVQYNEYQIVSKKSTYSDNITTWDSTVTLDHSSTSYNTSAIVPLASGKMYAVWQKGNDLKGAIYNGTSWGSTSTIVSGGIASGTSSISVVSVPSKDDVHVAYISNSGGYIRYIYYNGSSWGSYVTLDGTGTNYTPVISVDTNRNDNVHVAWIRNNQTIYYKRGVSPYASANFTSTADTIESTGTNKWLTTTFDTRDTNDFIILAWTEGSSSPYNIKWYKRSLYQPGNCVLDENSSRDQVIINWIDTNNQEKHYILQKSTNEGAYSTIGTLNANTTSYTDTSVSTGNSYQYKVYATDDVNESYACYTSKLTFATSSFGFEGVKLEGLEIN